jgi:Tol biopolymer transport system component
MEVWLRNTDDSDRPFVTAKDFGTGTRAFMTPVLAPDGGRAIYTRVDTQGDAKLWMSSVAGGPPVRVTNAAKGMEIAGSWSPDGSWFAYLMWRDGVVQILKVKTTGEAAPVMLHSGASSALPVWSPDGEWIALRDAKWNLYSVSSGKLREIGAPGSPALMFSKDGKRLYGMRGERGHALLFTVDTSSGATNDVADLGSDAAPRSSQNPGIRFSLAPDGESFVYSTARYRSNLWMIEGIGEKKTPGERLGLR